MKHYLITGGGFANKGAESMLYTLIGELKQRSNCSIIVHVVHGFDLVNHNIDGIKFIPFEQRYRNQALKPLRNFINHFEHIILNILRIPHKNKLQFLDAIKQSDIIFDISGYSLSSQWDKKAAQHIPNTIKLAKRYNKRVVLLPQSFGPFDFPKSYKLDKKSLQKILEYPTAIFCRESDGYKHMVQLGLTNNIYQSCDIVLQSTANYQDFLTKSDTIAIPEIKPHSVLIIPNLRVIERTDKNKILDLYRHTIELLISKKHNVYISYYDLSDIDICQEIVDMFPNDPNVYFIRDNLNCVQFNQILPGFDFIISSRFHSIVHAYKHGIPAIVIGWAIKYQELLESVSQQDKLYDGRYDISEDKFLASVSDLIENRDQESRTITKYVKKLQKNNCFEQLGDLLAQ